MDLAVHRPYFQVGEFGQLSQGEAMKAFDALQRLAGEYMHDMEAGGGERSRGQTG